MSLTKCNASEGHTVNMRADRTFRNDAILRAPFVGKRYPAGSAAVVKP
jgi:hypothetical protein